MGTPVPLEARHALRQVARTPGFSATVVLTLAVGLGATSAVFAVIDGVMLRPLPYRDAGRLVTVWTYNPANTFSGSRGLGGERVEPLTAVSPALLRELQPHLRAIEGAAGLSPSWSVSLTGNGNPEVVDAAYVTPSLPATLGLQPRLGRDFTSAEHAPGGGRVAIVSDALWRARFENRGTIADASIGVDGERHAIVGVMPAGATLPNTSAEVWLPFSLNPFHGRADIPITFVVGRLAPGATRGDAERELQRASVVLRPQLKALRGERLVLVPLGERMAAGSRRISLVLFAACALLTLIGCVNVSNLLLSRHAARGREIAMRAALGAGRGRLVRQFLIESAMLGVAGCAVGLVFAWLLVGYLRAWLGASLPVGVEISIDSGVVAFSLAASILASVLFGTAPAWHAARQDLAASLRATPRSVAGSDTRLRSVLIACEVALALVLVTGAALLTRSLIALSAVNPGFRIENVATGGLAFPGARYPQAAQRSAFVRRLEERLASVPGVVSVGFVNRLPLGGAANNIVPVEAEGFAPASGQPDLADRRVATPHYFSTIDVPLVRGRSFAVEDDADAPPVAIVNTAMARAVWRGADPIGRRVRIRYAARNGPWLTVVGTVGDLRHAGLDTAPRPELYVPYAQAPVESMVATVRASGPPGPLVETLRRTIWSLDPELPVAEAATMTEVVARSIAEPRSRTMLLSAVALVALVLSAIGIASVVAYAASRMRRDLGIRLALGATRRDVRRLVARRVLVPVLAGGVVGCALSVLATRALQGFLFDTAPGDPLAWVFAIAAVASLAWLAAALPAWRASRTNPMTVLRE